MINDQLGIRGRYQVSGVRGKVSGGGRGSVQPFGEDPSLFDFSFHRVYKSILEVFVDLAIIIIVKVDLLQSLENIYDFYIV